MKTSLASQALLFFGILFSLFGVFAAARTTFNLYVLDKYPTEGVIPNNLLISGSFALGYQSELDCTTSVNTYFDANGQQREATEIEKSSQDQYNATCYQRVAESRQKAKIGDIGMSAFLIFTGFGMLWARQREW